MKIMNTTFISTLQKMPEFRENVVKLIEKSFEYSNENHFDVDFYSLLSPCNSGNNFILLEEGSKNLIGHIGVKIRTFSEGTFATPVALLGGIAINPQYRGRGLFSKFFQKILDTFENQVSMFWLWSDHYELYRKFKFELCMGYRETAIKDDQLIIDDISDLSIVIKNTSEIQADEWGRLKQIYCNSILSKYACFHRNEMDWNDISKITSSKIYLFKDEAMTILGYCFCGKGMDLQNIVHEIAIDEKTKMQQKIKILNYIQRRHILWLPEISEYGSENIGQLKYLNLLRVGSSEKFKCFISQWSRNAIEVEDITNNEIKFNYNNQLRSERLEVFNQLLLGANPLPEWKNFGKNIYISGMDSI